jgi:hypothetical protein
LRLARFFAARSARSARRLPDGGVSLEVARRSASLTASNSCVSRSGSLRDTSERYTGRQLVGHVAREQAGILAAPITRECGGVVEARGLVGGGWKADERDALGQFVEKDEGSFGIRVWLAKRDAERLGVRPDDIDPSLRPPWPTPPPIGRGESRLSPSETEHDAPRSVVTVTCEEHYQETILTARPAGWGDRTWPLLVDLVAGVTNPHAKMPAECVGARIGDAPVGFFTAAMSDRHSPAIAAGMARGDRVTALATASLGEKGGATFWRLKVLIGG